MFMIVGFPWPVPSAHAQLGWHELPRDAPAICTADRGDHAIEETAEHLERRAEELVCWTGPERLRFQWYRLRLAVTDMGPAGRANPLRS
jgi:hypothetical protein